MIIVEEAARETVGMGCWWKAGVRTAAGGVRVREYAQNWDFCLEGNR